MPLHDSGVNRVPGREATNLEDDVASSFDILPRDRQDIVNHGKNRSQGGLDRIAAVDRGVAMQNFLQQYGICHQPLVATDRTFKKTLAVELVGMCLPDQIHRDV